MIKRILFYLLRKRKITYIKLAEILKTSIKEVINIEKEIYGNSFCDYDKHYGFQIRIVVPKCPSCNSALHKILGSPTNLRCPRCDIIYGLKLIADFLDGDNKSITEYAPTHSKDEKFYNIVR
jgi:hypothetical protein